MEAASVANVDYQKRQFDYVRAREHDGELGVNHPVAIVGAGPVGLATAIDLAQQGISVVLLDDDNVLSMGSRAICFAKRTLEVFDRLGCGRRMREQGVSWNVGKVFLQDELLYTFDLLPETGHANPAFINLQQYYVEGYLVERALELPNLEIRWKSKVTGVGQDDDAVKLHVETPDGGYALHAQYVVAADGARSGVRHALGLDSRGRTFKDRFLIADVKMKAPFPSERWFWFDPPFHRNQSVLLHKQPDDVWRIDFQLGWDADPVVEKQPERVIPRVKALLGEDVEFELEWVSIYTFSCLRMDSFRHGRVLFVGDSAHGVSPFGARGANSGVQDADNLAWKLKLVLQGAAPGALLDSYASEREYAADENILNSSRATDFITPKSAISRVFRDATLKLAKDCPFARRMVNSGRLSVPAVLADTPLNTPDLPEEQFAGQMALGSACLDAPVFAAGKDGWLLESLPQGVFAGIYFVQPGTQLTDWKMHLETLASSPIPILVVVVLPEDSPEERAITVGTVSAVLDVRGAVGRRFDATPGAFYLLRPDQHLCARWRNFDAARVFAALNRATCNA